MEQGKALGTKRHLDEKQLNNLKTFLIIWAVQMVFALFFCTQKQGFHEDEYYTYYSTARTNGFYVEDGQWMDRETYRNEFVVLPEQRFQYGLVKLVQSWDVHPPMYYWVFHTAASLVPGVFSMWIGLSVNLLFHGVNLILLTYLSHLISGRKFHTALTVTLFYGFTPAAISGVVFIRMYEMLTTFVLLCAILHVRAVQAKDEKLPIGRCLVPMAVVTYIGFLTQYYYFIFLFFMAVFFGIWMLYKDRKLWNCIRYGVAQGTAFAFAYLTYPSCLGQMFRGQRGAQATKNFFEFSNTFRRIGFFWGLLDRAVFGGLLWALVLLILVLAAVLFLAAYRRRQESHTLQADDRRGGDVSRTDGRHEESGFGIEYWMLAFTAAGYFLAVSKTGLLLGATSVRYQLPVYGIVVLLIFTGIGKLWQRAGALVTPCGDGETKTQEHAAAFLFRKPLLAESVAVIGCLAMLLSGHRTEGVAFLYPEDGEQTAFARECAAKDIPAVYLYKEGEEWCIWDVANELFAYPEVYFVNAGQETQGKVYADDERIRNAKGLVVYLAKGVDDGGKAMEIATGKGLDTCRFVFMEKYCDVYYFYKDE